MAGAFTSIPNPTSAWNFAGQHLIYTCFDSVSTPDRFVIKVYERPTWNSTTGQELIGTFYLTPNAEGRVHFDLSNVVEGRLAPPSNATNTGTQSVHTETFTVLAMPTGEKTGRSYYLELYTYRGTALSLDDDSEIAIFPGVVQLSQGLEPFIEEDYQFTNLNSKGFLTDRYWDSSTDIETTMAEEDEGIVTFINPDTFATSATNLATAKVSLYTSAGLSSSVSLITAGVTTVNLNYYLLPLAPSNASNMFGGSWVTNWTRYEIQFFDNAATPRELSRKYIVYKDCRPYKHDPVQLAWTNTVGGWDYLRFDGRNLKTVNSETKMYRKTIGTYGASTFDFNAWDRQDTPYHVTAREQYALRNQYFTASERELLQYAFRSKNVMFRVGYGSWFPCNIQTNSYTVQPATSKLFDVSFNIELAQEIRC